MNKPDSYNEIMPLISDNSLKAHIQNEWAIHGLNRGLEEILIAEGNQALRLRNLINQALFSKK